MSKQVAQDLRAAADVLERDGWTQGDMHRADGCHCAVGAIEVAVDPSWSLEAGWDDEQNGRFSAATGALSEFLNARPTYWNDARGRTAVEVIAALRAAADRAEAAS